MSDRTGGNQGGGIINSGTMDSGGGDIVGRDKIVGAPSAADLDAALRPLLDAVKAAPAGTREAAEGKIDALRLEAAKGDGAEDDAVAEIVEGLVELVPGAAGAAISAFGFPALGGIAGAATKYVLGKLQRK